MDSAVMARLKRRRIEAGSDAKSTQLYQSIATMKEFGMTPGQWAGATRIDKKIMMYHRAMESYNMDVAAVNARKKNEKPDTTGLPRLRRGLRR